MRVWLDWLDSIIRSKLLASRPTQPPKEYIQIYIYIYICHMHIVHCITSRGRHCSFNWKFGRPSLASHTQTHRHCRSYFLRLEIIKMMVREARKAERDLQAVKLRSQQLDPRNPSGFPSSIRTSWHLCNLLEFVYLFLCIKDKRIFCQWRSQFGRLIQEECMYWVHCTSAATC